MAELLAHLSTTVAALLQRHFQTSVPPDSSLPLVLAMGAVVLTFSVPSLIWSVVCGLCCRCRKSHKKSKSIVPAGTSALTYDAFDHIGSPLFLVDAFAARPFGGNNAAIVILDDPTKMENEQWLQKVAQETLQPMTAFLLRRDKTNYTIRWFTRDHENKLCGHASLGAAHVLFSTGAVPSNVSISFHSHLAGVLSATCVTQFGSSNLQGRCQLGFPASQVTHKFPVSEALQEGLDIKAAVGLEIEDVSYLGSNGTLLLIEVREPHLLNLIIPDEKILREWATRGVVITAPLKSGQTVDSVFNNGIDTPVDFVSRVFYVTKGRVDEDPVTGSAHCLLATHYHERTKKTSFVAYQASARGGLLELHLVEGKTRVKIAGDATTIMQGRLIA